MARRAASALSCDCHAQAGTESPPPFHTITVALAGQPNVGKTTVFNLLTGLSQHVGNWPGKTVEQKSGFYTCDGLTMRIVDLPGTYSLTANSVEEQVARDFIIRERPDVVVVVVDAATLERNLYLLAELLHLPAPVILGLNMVDVAEQQGLHIEPHVLEAALGIPVVPMVASRNQGICELVRTIVGLVRGEVPYTPHRPEIREDHRQVLASLQEIVHPYVPDPYPVDWIALKLLEGDSEITQMLQTRMPETAWKQAEELLHRHEDAVLAVAGGRYDWIGRMVRAAVVRPRAGHITLTERIDRVATHPFWGLVLLGAVLAVTFWLTYAIALPIQRWLGNVLVQRIAERVATWLAPAPGWLSGLIVDGAIGGVGSMLTFVPILTLFFATMGLLEDVGYMARAAYVMDRFMHLLGLHGKSFLPLFLGFGCNVPSVMGTRIIEERRARLLTILVAPLVPCPARMAVVALLAPAFFGAQAVWVSGGLVFLSLLTLALSGALLNRILFRGEHAAFIMELPLYHIPNPRTIGLLVWQRLVAFIRKAGTVILAVSVVVWAVSHFPGGTIEESLLGHLGQWLSPLGAWMGLDWRMLVALLTSFIAKENAVATLAVLYGAGRESLPALLRASVSPASGLAFLVATMLFIPCVATFAVMRQETGSWKWVLFGTGFLLILSFGAAALVFQVARLLGGA
ncbi:MAG: ferrous iron transport protein B [Chloroflexia bacterium]